VSDQLEGAGARPTDTLAALAAAWRRLGSPHASAMRPGLAPEDLAARLRPWSRSLPTSLASLYAWADGLGGDLEFFPGARFLSNDEALQAYRSMLEVAATVTASTSADPSTVWDRKWLPVFAADGGFYLIASSTRGKPESPVWFKDEEDPDVSLAYDNLAALLATVAECYRSGAYAVGDDGHVNEAAERSAEVFRKHNPRAAAAPVAAQEAAAVVAGLLDLLARGDGIARGKAAETLMKRRDPIAVPGLIALLSHGHPAVRGLAARTLEKIKDARAVPALIACLGDEDEFVRGYAAMALAAIGDRRAAGPLIEALRASRPEKLGGVALALGLLNAVESIDDFLPHISPGQPPAIRARAVSALGTMIDPRIPGILVPLLADADLQVRSRAVAGLARGRYPEAVEPLLAYLGDADWQMRIAVVGALEAIGDPAAIEHIRSSVDSLAPADDDWSRTLQDGFRTLAQRAVAVLSKSKRR
jgi:HEAT repeat protein